MLLIVAAGRTAAASPGATAAIAGVVVDSTGAVLPGADVRLTGASGAPILASTTTGADGTFAFSGLRPGRYRVRAALNGFEARTVPVRVGARGARRVRIMLALAGVHQEITVTSRTPHVATGAAANADAVTVNQHDLESLPIFDDDAVATLSRFLDSGAIGTSGVTLVVNGMEVNSLDVSTSAIQQIKINQDPYSAAYSRPGRGRIEILTKPGSQAYHGDGSVIFRDSALNARNPFAAVRPPEQRHIGDGDLGGPVGHGGDTSFMLSVKDDSERRQAIVYALGPDGPIQGEVSQPYRHLLASLGVTRQHGRSTISIRPSYEQETDDRGVGGTTLGSAGTVYYHRETDLTYSQQTIFRPTLLNQFQILVGQELEPLTSATTLPGVVVAGAFTGGGAQVDVRRTELHFQLSDSLTLTRGRHLLQIGFQIPDWSRRRFDDHSQFGGTYYFSDLSADAAGQPYAYVQRTGNGHVVWLEKVLGAYVNDDWRVRPGATLSFGLRYDWSNYFADHDNLAPRFSFAIRPGGSKATVIRGGAGLFYDKVGPFPVIDVLDFRPGGIQQIVITSPAYPNPFAPGAASAAAPLSITEFAPGIQVPWNLQYSAGVEHQLLKTTTLSVMYYGSDATLFRSRDINAPLPPLYTVRPNPAFGVIAQIDSSARQLGNALQVTLRGRMGRWFNGQVQYTFSRTFNNSGGLNWFPANDYNLSGEWARADFDRRHRLLLLGSMRPGRRFDVGMALTLESGLPYSETVGGDPYNNGRGNARPPGVTRNSLQGAAYADLDLRISRDFAWGAGRVLTVGLDGFNLLNRANYALYVGTVTSPLFGQPVTAQAPRELQLSASLKF